MLNDLIFCLNGTLPIFLMMLLGVFLRKTGIMNEKFTAGLNSFVFRVSLPLLLFSDMGKMDFHRAWDGGYVLFCFLATCASILMVIGISYLLKKKDIRGEFIQVSYRSSAALLGAALAVNLYGTTGMIPLMIIGAVPLYNVAAVTVLSVFRPGMGTFDRGRMKETLRGIVTNPLIIAIVCGLVWSLSGIRMPGILSTAVDGVGQTATPLGLIALGAAFDFRESLHYVKEAGLGSFLKLIGLGCIFLPIAVKLGFRNSELVAAMIMCGSPTTVSSYVMAREMGHKGVLTSSVVMLTNLLCPLTLFIFRTHGLL